MADDLAELKAMLDSVVTKQTQIEQGLHMLLGALQVQLPLISDMSERIDDIAADLASLTHNAGSLASDVEDIRSSLENDGK